MQHAFHNVTFTPSVKAQQRLYGALPNRVRGDEATDNDKPRYGNRFGADEAAFLAARDSFYLASVSETGWPYVQHRGGPPGFLRVLDETTFGWADFAGNRQYITMGNVSVDERVAIIAMDYARRGRIKLLGRMSVFPAREKPELVAALTVPGYRARIERAIVVKLEAFDWNCPQHIEPRYTMAEIEPSIAALQARIADLEQKLAAAGKPDAGTAGG